MKSLAEVQNELITSAVSSIVPEAVLVGTACLLFMAAVIVPRRSLALVISFVGIIAAAVIAAFDPFAEVAQFQAAVQGTEFSASVLAPIDPTGLAGMIRWICLVAAGLFLCVAWPELRAENACEYCACLLVTIAGASLTGRANDLISLFLALELVSIPTYGLLYLPMRNPGIQEASAKYFLLSVLSSGFLLFGMSYLYGLTGTTNIGAIVAILSSAQTTSPLAMVGAVMVIAGLSFRIAAVPFHFYAPDVYQGGPISVVAQLAFLPKLVGFVALARLFGLVANCNSLVPFEANTTLVPLALWVLALVTMTLGNVMALLQENIRRMLAYSGIAHSGYMFLGILVASAVPGASLAMVSGIDTLLFYLVAYGLMTIGFIALLSALNSGEQRYEQIEELGGLGQSRPLIAGMMAVFLFSLIGLPLTAGFAGKLLLFVGAFDAPVEPPMKNLYRMLAVVAAVNAAIGAVYYLRILAVLYLRQPLSEVKPPRPLLPLAAAMICAIGTLVFGIYPQPLSQLSRDAAPIAPITTVMNDQGK